MPYANFDDSRYGKLLIYHAFYLFLLIYHTFCLVITDLPQSHLKLFTPIQHLSSHNAQLDISLDLVSIPSLASIVHFNALAFFRSRSITKVTSLGNTIAKI
jgi:hypothetical protein